MILDYDMLLVCYRDQPRHTMFSAIIMML